MNDIYIHGFHDTHVTIKWLYLYIVTRTTRTLS